MWICARRAEPRSLKSVKWDDLGGLPCRANAGTSCHASDNGPGKPDGYINEQLLKNRETEEV